MLSMIFLLLLLLLAFRFGICNAFCCSLNLHRVFVSHLRRITFWHMNPTIFFSTLFSSSLASSFLAHQFKFSTSPTLTRVDRLNERTNEQVATIANYSNCQKYLGNERATIKQRNRRDCERARHHWWRHLIRWNNINKQTNNNKTIFFFFFSWFYLEKLNCWTAGNRSILHIALWYQIFDGIDWRGHAIDCQ